MAYPRLGQACCPALVIALAFASACGPRIGDGAHTATPVIPNREVFAIDRKLARFHSKRFLITIALPDGRGWQIDDHTKSRLVALHPRTETRLEVEAFDLGELASRQKCRDAGFSRLKIDLHAHSIIEQTNAIGPEAYDTELQTTLEADPRKQQVRAHFFAFAGFLRRCIVMHIVTLGKPETLETLSDRLVTFRAQAWGHLKVDDFLAQPRERRTPIAPTIVPRLDSTAP